MSATVENCAKHWSKATLHFHKAVLLNKLLCACFLFAFGVMASTRLTREEMEAELTALRADNQRLSNSLCALQIAFVQGHTRPKGVNVCFDIPALERFYFEGHEMHQFYFYGDYALHFSEAERQMVLTAFLEQDLKGIRLQSTCGVFNDILLDTLGFPVAVYYKRSRNDEVVKFDVRLDPQNTTVRDVYKALVKLSPTTFPALVNDNALLPVFFAEISVPRMVISLQTVGNRRYEREADMSVSRFDPLQVWFPVQEAQEDEDESDEDEDEDEDERPEILRCFFNFLGFGNNETVEWLIGSDKTVYQVKDSLTFRIDGLTAEDIYLVYDDFILHSNFIFSEVVPDEATVAVCLHTPEDEDESDDDEALTVRERLEHLISRVADEHDELPDGWDAQITEYIDLFAPTPDTPWDAEDIPHNELELLAEDYFGWMGYNKEAETLPYLFRWIGRDTDTVMEVEIHRAQNVYEVKYYLTEEEPNLYAKDIRLAYRDNVLENDEANFFDIVPANATVQVFINGRGGGSGNKRSYDEMLEETNEEMTKHYNKVAQDNNWANVLQVVKAELENHPKGSLLTDTVKKMNKEAFERLSDNYWNCRYTNIPRIVPDIAGCFLPMFDQIVKAEKDAVVAKRALLAILVHHYTAEFANGQSSNGNFEALLEAQGEYVEKQEKEAQMRAEIERQVAEAKRQLMSTMAQQPDASMEMEDKDL